MNACVIEFRFPGEAVVYAGDHKGACGFAPSIATARIYATEREALNALTYGYGPALSQVGYVMPVKAVAA